MIKINLLPAKRAKRVQISSAGGQREMAIGLASLAGVALVVFFAVDQPKRSHLRDLRDVNAQLNTEIEGKDRQLVDFPNLKKLADDATTRARSINRLIAAKIVPANVLQELGDILTANHLPTMTEEMARRTGNGPQSDPNRRYDLAWDPTRVWLTAFNDSKGELPARGGWRPGRGRASRRLVQADGRHRCTSTTCRSSQEERVSDKDTGTAYYKFTITGKVNY